MKSPDLLKRSAPSAGSSGVCSATPTPAARKNFGTCSGMIPAASVKSTSLSRSAGLPRAAISPSLITTSRSAARASSVSCSMTISVRAPLSRSALAILKTPAFPRGSRSVVGSSMQTMSGCMASTEPMARRCF